MLNKNIKDNKPIKYLLQCTTESTSKRNKADHPMNKLHKVGTVYYFNITFKIWSQTMNIFP